MLMWDSRGAMFTHNVRQSPYLSNPRHIHAHLPAHLASENLARAGPAHRAKGSSRAVSTQYQP